jgi:hypothetical protein
MAVTNADILGWLNANPGADAALINQTMAEAGVSSAQYQSATGAPLPPAPQAAYVPPAPAPAPAVTNADILGWFNANPNASDALIAKTMQEAGVTPARLAQVTGAPVAEVTGLFQSAIASTPTPPTPVATPAPKTITDLYQQELGRPPESKAVVDEWKRIFGDTIEPNEVETFKQATQLEKTNPVAANIKGQLLSQWSKLGVTELPGGISLEERASALADTMKQNGITNLADLKLGSKTIQTGEDGSTINASFLSNKGEQLGFLGNVNENLKNKADYLQPDNLLSWSSEGKGNVGYKAVETADGGVAIVPQWNSSSDLKTIRNIAKLAAAVYFGGMGLESLGATGTAGASAAGLTAAEAAGLGLTAAEASALGLSAAEFAAAAGTAGAVAGTVGTTGLTMAELAQLDLALGGAGGTAGATSLANALMTGATIPTITALTGGSGLLTGAAGGITAESVAAKLAGGAGVASILGGAGSALPGLSTGLPSSVVNAGVSTAVNKILGGGGATSSNLSNLFSGGLGTAGNLLQMQQSREAAQQAQARIDAETAAAKASAAFRPVGMTTRFGTSQFQVDPVTGQLTSAGYTLSPEAKAQQDRFMALSNAGLTQAEQAQAQFAPLQTGAQNLFNLGNQYIAQSPESVAQNYLNQQMALLQPGRELELANLQNRLQQQGRGGLAVAQGGTLGATTPELQALYNARAQQEAQLAAQAQQAGQQQVAFGAGLLGQGAQTMGQYYGGQQAAYAPYTTAMGQVQGLEALGQQPLTTGINLGQISSQAGANVGKLGLEGARLSAGLATSADATRNLLAQSLIAGGNPNAQFGSAIGGLLGGGLQSAFSGTGLGSSGFGTGLAYGNQDLGLYL